MRWKTILTVKNVVLFKYNIVSPVGLGPDFNMSKPAAASPLWPGNVDLLANLRCLLFTSK